ncbi:MAG TPA: DinB family protein, partial [Mucilaginibacter sp.]|nr:DinB family protein [Mucilaginibacter sp.]
MKISDSITCRLKLQHETISEIIFDLDEQQLFKKLQPDKWNIPDNIAHLTRYQLVFMERINKILSAE